MLYLSMDLIDKKCARKYIFWEFGSEHYGPGSIQPVKQLFPMLSGKVSPHLHDTGAFLTRFFQGGVITIDPEWLLTEPDHVAVLAATVKKVSLAQAA